MPSTDAPQGQQGAGAPPATPRPLLIAAVLVLVEALLLLGLGVAEVVALDGDRLTMGVTTSGFFLAAAAGLGACAAALSQGRRWGRGPALLAQLIALGLAWSLRGQPTTLAAAGLALVALVALAGIVHPASVDVLEQRDA